MRLVLIGQAQFGRDCLQALLDRREDVVGVITIPRGEKTNPLEEMAVNLGLPLITPSDLKGGDVCGWIDGLAPDLLVLAYVTDRVPGEVIRLFPCGGINYHPSLLPRYRGGSAIAWAIICGEKETGVTIHYIDEGIDTGDIILQESVPISPEDTTVTLYFNKLYPMGVRLLVEAVRLIGAGKAPRIPQDGRIASFHPVLREADVLIDWRQSAGNIYNLIKGAMPALGARTSFRDEGLVIWDAFPLERDGFSSSPGRIEETGPEGLVVATGTRLLLVKKVTWGWRRVTAVEFAGLCSLQPGEAFV